MDTRKQLPELVGEWTGTNRLWLDPSALARESTTTATVERVAGGFVSIRTTWEDEGRAHDGLLVVRLADDPGADTMVWVDSFHTGGAFMTFAGTAGDDGRVTARGSYAAPPGPDWGWRIAVEAESADGFRILMHNITPDGEEAPAVEAVFTRAG